MSDPLVHMKLDELGTVAKHLKFSDLQKQLEAFEEHANNDA